MISAAHKNFNDHLKSSYVGFPSTFFSVLTVDLATRNRSVKTGFSFCQPCSFVYKSELSECGVHVTLLLCCDLSVISRGNHDVTM